MRSSEKPASIGIVLAFALAFAVSGSFRAAAFANEGDRRIEKSTFEVPGHAPLVAELRVPKNARKLPALLLFGGFQNAGQVLDLVRTTEPIVLASFDYPFSPPRKFAFPAGLALAPEARRMIHHMNAAIPALVRHLAARPDIDRDRITVVGASLGAPFALDAAAAEPLVRAVAVVHGFGDVPATIAWQFERKWVPKHGAWTSPFAWLLGRLAWWYAGARSPEENARNLRASQDILLIQPERDGFVPAGARESLDAAIADSAARVTRVTTPGDHLQPGSDALIERILRDVTAWMRDRRLIQGRGAGA